MEFFRFFFILWISPTIIPTAVMIDESGKPKGFGFVHFAMHEEANNAVDKVNGLLLAKKKFMFDQLDEEKLCERFSKNGKL
ncbi:unnamed protein product [Rotaria sp. Silwood2]|nr:unnamed protein product [Rotaria sp. Silwood2]